MAGMTLGQGKQDRLRVAMYSHDAVGLGHLRRNLLIAQILAESDLRANVLTVSGAAETKLFPTPKGVDSLTLPALRKHDNGTYESRSLDVSLEELGKIRSATIRAGLAAFRPDILIVDKVPSGAIGELLPILGDLRERGETQCVLGLRDILDDPAAVRAEWIRRGYSKITEDFYDAVWVYGDQQVYDVVREYGFSQEIASRIRYTGYFDRSAHVATGAGTMPFKSGAFPRRYVLCLVGGGQDGNVLAESFAAAKFPAGVEGVILTGPFLSHPMSEMLRRSVRHKPHIHVIDFLSDPAELIARAEKVVGMGGYNTICEVLSHERPMLIVPRIAPRTEQLIRARRLAQLGVVDYLLPDDARPAALSAWIAAASEPPAGARAHIDFQGLQRLPTLVSELMSSSRRARGTAAC